jgi:hypothetical protein
MNETNDPSPFQPPSGELPAVPAGGVIGESERRVVHDLPIAVAGEVVQRAGVQFNDGLEASMHQPTVIGGEVTTHAAQVDLANRLAATRQAHRSSAEDEVPPDENLIGSDE